jgi:hypothetical protein
MLHPDIEEAFRPEEMLWATAQFNGLNGERRSDFKHGRKGEGESLQNFSGRKPAFS